MASKGQHYRIVFAGCGVAGLPIASTIGARTVPERPPQAHLMVRRAVARATFGTALEWFDFALYGVVAATISEAVLSVARPDRVAGKLLGGARGPSARRGDLRHARRNLMLVTVSVMGPPSFRMGLLTVTSSRAVIDCEAVS